MQKVILLLIEQLFSGTEKDIIPEIYTERWSFSAKFSGYPM